MYWTAIFATYARSDDYIYTYDARTGTLGTGVGRVWLDAGRVVPSVLYQWVFPKIGDVDDLWALRLVSTVVLAAGAALFGVLCLGVIGSTGWLARLLAVCVGGVAVTTTAAPSSVTWVVMAGQMPALAFAVAAGLTATWGRTPWRWLAVAALVLLSTFSYQHFAPIAFFVSALGTAALWARRERARLFDPIAVGLLVVGTIALNFVFVGWRSGSALDRISGPTTSERLTWFTGEFLPRTVDLAVPWSMSTSQQSAVVAGVLLLLAGLRGPRFLVLPVAVLVSWLCASVVIIPGELWASYRLVAAAQLVLWVGAACCAAVGISAAYERRTAVGIPLLAAATIATAYSASISHQRAVDYFAAPSVRDWDVAQCVMRQTGPIGDGTRVRQSPYEETTSPVLSYDEYGSIGTSAFFAVQYVAWLALDEADGPGRPAVDVADLVVVPPTDPGGDWISFAPDACERR